MTLKRTPRSTSTPPLRATAFGLIDPENATIFRGRRLPLPAAAAVLDEVEYYVTAMPTCAALTRPMLAPYVPILASRGWALQLVATGPDAADLALMERARFAIDHGYDDLVIVSGDHIFAELAGQARLHVVSHPDRLSHVLRSVATSVSYLGEATSPLIAA